MPSSGAGPQFWAVQITSTGRLFGVKVMTDEGVPELLSLAETIETEVLIDSTIV